MPSEIVGGQEVDAVNAAMTSALERARSDGGPAFLECKTYRYSGHSRADPGSYRPEGDLDEWLARDPITLYRARLIAGGLLDEAAADELAADVERRVEECIGRVMASELADVASMFSNVRSDTDTMSGVEPALLTRLGETVDEVGAVVQVALRWSESRPTKWRSRSRRRSAARSPSCSSPRATTSPRGHDLPD